MFSKLQDNLSIAAVREGRIEFEKKFRQNIIEFLSAEIKKLHSTDSTRSNALNSENSIEQSMKDIVAQCETNPDIEVIYQGMNELTNSLRENGDFYKKLQKESRGNYEEGELVNDMQGYISIATLGYYTKELPQKLASFQQIPLSELKNSNKFNDILLTQFGEIKKATHAYLLKKLSTNPSSSPIMALFEKTRRETFNLEYTEATLLSKKNQLQKQIKTLELSIATFESELQRELSKKTDLLTNDQELKNELENRIDRAIEVAQRSAASAADVGSYESVDEKEITRSIIENRKTELTREIDTLKSKMMDYKNDPQYVRYIKESKEIEKEIATGLDPKLKELQKTIAEKKDLKTKTLKSLAEIEEGKALFSLDQAKEFKFLDIYFSKFPTVFTAEYMEKFNTLQDTIKNQIQKKSALGATLFSKIMHKETFNDSDYYISQNPVPASFSFFNYHQAELDSVSKVFEKHPTITPEALWEVQQAEGEFRGSFRQTINEIVKLANNDPSFKKAGKNVLNQKIFNLLMMSGQNSLYPWQMICLPVLLKMSPDYQKNKTKFDAVEEKLSYIAEIMRQSVRILNNDELLGNKSAVSRPKDEKPLTPAAEACHLAIADLMESYARELKVDGLLHAQEREVPKQWTDKSEILDCSAERRQALNVIRKIKEGYIKKLERNANKVSYAELVEGLRTDSHFDIFSLGILRMAEKEILSGKAFDVNALNLDGFYSESLPKILRQELSVINLKTTQKHIDIEISKEFKTTDLDPKRKQISEKIKNKLQSKYLTDWNNAVQKYKTTYVENKDSDAYKNLTRISQKVAVANYLQERVCGGYEIDPKTLLDEVRQKFDASVFQKTTFGNANTLEKFIQSLPKLTSTISQQVMTSATVSFTEPEKKLHERSVSQTTTTKVIQNLPDLHSTPSKTTIPVARKQSEPKISEPKISEQLSSKTMEELSQLPVPKQSIPVTPEKETRRVVIQKK